MKTSNIQPGDYHRQAKGLMIFFALMFIAEGLGQPTGLINQPLNFYLLKTYGWDAVKINAFISVLVIYNLATPASSNSGSYLYERVFHHELQPVILVSAAVTLLALFLVPMLKLGDLHAGSKPA